MGKQLKFEYGLSTSIELCPTEVIQTGMKCLIKFNCVSCRSECLTSLDSPLCDSCDTNYIDAIVKLPKTSDRKRWRLLVGQKLKRPRISKKLKQLVYDETDGRCGYCEVSLEDKECHIDHILPFCIGGPTVADNLVAACRRCNLVASSLVFNSLMAKKSYVLDKIASTLAEETREIA